MAADTVAPFAHVSTDFELVDKDGAVVTSRDLRGNYVLLAFGFTNCAHICPMVAANMARALRLAARDAIGVFVSVDTERDTPAVTAAFASGFHDSIVGLSGNYAQIKSAAENFGVSFVVTKSHKAYTVEHTSDIFLIAPDGRLVDVFALNAQSQDIARAMNQTVPH
jgi:cytochrome oxidase Cu insertion factor (SCO1/SenC/PrrC family)